MDMRCRWCMLVQPDIGFISFKNVFFVGMSNDNNLTCNSFTMSLNASATKFTASITLSAFICFKLFLLPLE